MYRLAMRSDAPSRCTSTAVAVTIILYTSTILRYQTVTVVLDISTILCDLR